jgi:hypothetical protein
LNSATVTNNLFVGSLLSASTVNAGTMSVSGESTLASTSIVNLMHAGYALVDGTLTAGATTLSSATVTNNLFVGSLLSANTVNAGTMSVSGQSTLSSTSIVNLMHAGYALVDGTLNAGATTLNSATVTNNLFVGSLLSANTVNAGTMSVSGQSTLASTSIVNLMHAGYALVDGTLTAGATTLSSATVTNNLYVGNDLSIAGSLYVDQLQMNSLTVVNTFHAGSAVIDGNISASSGSFSSATISDTLTVEIIQSSSPLTSGTGITSTALYRSSILREGEIITTRIYIDLRHQNPGLYSSNVNGGVIGEQATANCNIGQYSLSNMGTIVATKIICLQEPTTGLETIGLSYNTTSGSLTTGDTTGLVPLITPTSLSSGITISSGNTVSSDSSYFYLTSNNSSTGNYAQGKLMIEIYGIIFAE